MARLRPSGAHRWITCAGAPNAEAGLPDEVSEAAAEGTAAHQVRSECLLFDIDAEEMIGTEIRADGHTFLVDRDMADFLQPGIERVREFEGDLVVEHEVDLSTWIPGQTGTLDAGIIGTNEIVIDDLKFGRGVSVSAVENDQLMLYALAFWDNLARHHTKAKTFRLVIDQPRLAGGGGEWIVTLDELLCFGEKAVLAAKATEDPNAPRTASLKGCQFCKARPTCDEYARFNLDMFGMDFLNLDAPGEPKLPDPRQMTPERRSYVVRHASMFSKWLGDLSSEALNDALAGRPTPGLKAVLGKRSARKWSDEEKAQAYLLERLSHDQVFNRELVSVSQAEKLLSKTEIRKAEVEGIVTLGKQSPTLVPETDSREAVNTYLDQLPSPAEIEVSVVPEATVGA